MTNKLKLKDAIDTGMKEFSDALFNLLDADKNHGAINNGSPIIVERFTVNEVNYKVWLTKSRAGLMVKDGEIQKHKWTNRNSNTVEFPYARLLEWLVNDIVSHY